MHSRRPLLGRPRQRRTSGNVGVTGLAYKGLTATMASSSFSRARRWPEPLIRPVRSRDRGDPKVPVPCRSLPHKMALQANYTIHLSWITLPIALTGLCVRQIHEELSWKWSEICGRHSTPIPAPTGEHKPLPHRVC